MALEDPKDASITQRLPALTARLNHQFANNFNVSARAMGHEKRTNTDEEMAWGVGLGAKYEVVPGTTLKQTTTMSKAIAVLFHLPTVA